MAVELSILHFEEIREALVAAVDLLNEIDETPEEFATDAIFERAEALREALTGLQ